MRRLLVLCVVASSATAAGRPLRRAEPVIVPDVVRPYDSSPTRVLFLDRCAGNCVIKFGGDDAANGVSSLPMPATQSQFTISAFAFGDDTWAAVLACVRDVYSPYNVMIVEQQPTSGAFNRTVVAGVPGDIGWADDILGIAPLSGSCAVLSNATAFAFANQHPSTDRVNQICWTVSQESAHIYGLDHEYQFVDGTSACNDPMTYRNDCGGEKFFRDEDAQCGEYTTRACKCTATQNSHQGMLDRFGAGTPTTAPTISMLIPKATQTDFIQGQAAQAQEFSLRGIAKSQLLLNGYPWVTTPGIAYGPEGQAQADYSFAMPPDVPDGVIDIAVNAIDDIGLSTLSSTVTVTKGAPCVDTSKCLTGQLCGAGKCFWNPPTGEIGDACDFPQACISGVCDSALCVQPCEVGKPSTCPSAFTCEQNAAQPTCVPTTGGCCSVGRDGGVQALLGMVGLGLLLRPRRGSSR
jgi:hypothetical protein